MDDCTKLEENISIANKVLANLERTKAMNTLSSMPPNLEIDIEEKQKEIEELKKRLEEAKSLQKENEQVSEEDVSYTSPIRERVPDEYYIEREEAKRFLKRFDEALKQPEGNPLVFNIHGIGGVGKTTLRGRIIEAKEEKADFLKVCFQTTHDIETPLKLMRTLSQQANQRFGNILDTNSFAQIEKQFEYTLFQLCSQTVNREATSRDEARKIRSWFERIIWLDPKGLSSTTNRLKSFDTFDAGFSNFAKTGEDAETFKESIEQIVRNHPATKDKQDLKDLMLNPISRLTQAFAGSLQQIARHRNKPLVIVLDTYEKAQSYLDRWFWQYLVADTSLASSSVRFLVMGRKSLTENEGWRKLNQDRKLLYDLSLQRFDKELTKNYLQQIGITKGSDIARIYKITKGLPYYLNWIKTQKDKGEELDFSLGNQEIAQLFFQGLNPKAQQVLQLVSCCRWFDLSTIKYLLKQECLGFQKEIDRAQEYFDWLKKSDFVEFSKRRYRLDDVARDVFRQSYFQDDQDEFRLVNALLAKYFEQRAELLYELPNSLIDAYQNEEWRRLISESLYYGFFGNGTKGLYQYIEQVLIAVYFQEPDLFTVPFSLICAEINQENNYLLPKPTDKFFRKCDKVLIDRWILLDKHPESYDLEFDNEKQVSPEEIEKRKQKIETSLQALLDYVGNLQDNLGKLIGLIYKSLYCKSYKEKKSSLAQAKVKVEQLELNNYSCKLIYSLLLQLGMLQRKADLYEDSLFSYEKALDFGSSNTLEFCIGYGCTLGILGKHTEALSNFKKAVNIDSNLSNCWRLQGYALFCLKRYEEALESYQQAINLDPSSGNAWGGKGDTLFFLERYEEALKSYQQAINLDPNSISFWEKKGNILFCLKRYEEALKSCQQVINLNASSSNAWENKGDVLFSLERYEESLKSYQQAINLDPNSSDAWRNKGDALRNLRLYEQSLEDINRALKIKPQNSEYFNSQALTISLLQGFDGAITAIDRAITLEPEESLYKANRGIILARAKRFSEAFAECEKAIAQNPKHESGYYAIACCYALNEEIDLAIDNLQMAIDISPQNSRSEAKHNPDFDNIRDNERFKALVYPE